MDTDIIARTWDAFADRHERLIGKFYERFFERYPQYRSLFPASLDRQMKKMINTIGLVSRMAENRSTVAPHVERVGLHHKGYALGQQDLENFRDVFLEVLGEECGERWEPECAQAWKAAFDEVIIPHIWQGMHGGAQ